MRFVSFLNRQHEERLGLLVKDQILDLKQGAEALSLLLPSTMAEFLKGGRDLMDTAKKVENAFLEGKILRTGWRNDLTLLASVPHPTSCRDASAFRNHVAATRQSRGLELAPEFDQFPVFFYFNHNSIIGEGNVIVEEDHLKKLDFELEAAVVIGKKGRNIEAKDADNYIAGFTILNDFSARQLQMEEMALNLGPAKGKDFATALGPALVTPDELADNRIATERGNRYKLTMVARHNGRQVSQGNLKEMTWTFAEIIERASYGVDLYPGDVIGSGAVESGSLLELNETWGREAKKEGRDFHPIWLKEGDTIELEIEGLGILKNCIVKSGQGYSILNKKRTQTSEAG